MFATKPRYYQFLKSQKVPLALIVPSCTTSQHGYVTGCSLRGTYTIHDTTGNSLE